jgi:HlyD family secretion protein
VLIVAAIVAGVLTITTTGGAAYRTAIVTRGSVAQTLTTTGVLSPVRSSDVDFQVAGTVSKVRAVVGHKVVAGKSLAWLDRASLQATLGAARAEVTSARERLSENESSETTGTTSAVSSTASASTTAASFDAARPAVVTTGHPQPTKPPQPQSGSSPGPVTTATLTRDQKAIRAAQRATDADLATASTALSTETTACAALATTPPPGSLTCTQAATGLLHDQQAVNRDETAVDNAEQTLSRDLETALKALQQQEKSGGSSTGGKQRTTTGSTSARSSGVTVTAADIATDQATIDQAAAQVATAKANLRQATLTAPISGTITAVTISKGDTVAGASSATQPAIEIVGSRQDKTTVFLSDTQVRTIKVGLRADVTPDGSSRSVSGQVVGIGLTGTESTTGSVSYPVTINLGGSGTPLVAGADAAVSITLATANGVIAVPTSAVHYQGSTAYVTMLTASKPSRHTVQVGTIGPALTEVTSGLAVGQRVVLANLHAAVPSSSTTLTGRTGFGGGFGGAGFGGAGFGGGARPGGAGGTGRTFVGP